MLGNEVSWLNGLKGLLKQSILLMGDRHSLASAEINLLLAVLFRPNGPFLELFETDETDVIQAHDFLLPVPKLDTKGIRVIVK